MDNSEFSELSELQPCFMVMNSQPEESQNLGHKQYHQQQIRKLTALCDNQSSSIHTPMASQEHGKDKGSKQEDVTTEGRIGNHDNISAGGHDDSGSVKVQDGTDCHVDASHSFDKSPSVNANPSSSSKRGHLNQDYHSRSNQHHDNSSLTTTSSSISSSIYPGTTSIESATTSLGSFTSVTSPTHLNPNKDDAGLATGKINRLENQDKEVEVIVIPSQDDGITASQHDMFDEEDNQDASQKDRHVNTPSTTVAALHLSGGTFVHETETSASDDCIPPTPDAFGPAPIMIPDSPTDGIAEEDDKSVAKVDDDTYIDSDEEIQIPRWQQVLNEEQKALRTISSTAATTTSTGSDSDKSSNTKDTTSKSKETNSQSTSLQAWQSSLPLAITTDDSSISKSASLGTKKDVSNRTSDQRSLEKGNASQNSEKTSAVTDPMGRCVDGTKDPGHRSLMRISQRHGSQNEETKTGSQEGLRVLGPEEPDMSEDPFRITPSHRPNTDGGNECNETRIEEAETVESESMRLHLSASAAMSEQSVQPMDQGPDESENQQCEMEVGDSLAAVAAENKKDGVTGQDGGKIIEESSHGTEDWGLCLSPSQGDTESQAAVGLRVAKNFGSSSRLDESINSEDMAIPQFQNTSAVSDKNDSERKSPSQSLLTKTNISGIKDKTERPQSGNDSFHGHHSDNKQRRLFDTEKTTPNQAARNTPLVSPVEETSMPTDGRNSQASERTETPIGVEVSDITGTSDNMTTTPNPTAVTSGNNDSEKNQGTEQSGGFQFNIPTEGLLLRPVVSVTPPSVKQRKRQPRHSTPLAPSKQTADAKTSDRTQEMMDQFTNKKEEEQIGRKKASLAESAALQGSTAKLTSLKVGFVAPSQESSDTPVFHLQKPESVPEDGVAVSVKTTESVFTKIKEFKELKTVETQKSQPSQCSEDPFEFKVLREKKSERKEKSRHDSKEKCTKTNTVDQARIEGNGLKAKVQEEKRNDQVEEMDVDGFEGNAAAETVESEDLFASQPIERRQRRKAVKLTDSQEIIEQNQTDLQNINQGDNQDKEECHDRQNTESISMEVVSEIPDKSQSRSKIKTIGTTAPRDPYDFSDSQSNKVPTPKKLHPANLGNDTQEQPQIRTRGRAPSGNGGNNNGSDRNGEDENRESQGNRGQQDGECNDNSKKSQRSSDSDKNKDPSRSSSNMPSLTKITRRTLVTTVVATVVKHIITEEIIENDKVIRRNIREEMDDPIIEKHQTENVSPSNVGTPITIQPETELANVIAKAKSALDSVLPSKQPLNYSSSLSTSGSLSKTSTSAEMADVSSSFSKTSSSGSLQRLHSISSISRADSSTGKIISSSSLEKSSTSTSRNSSSVDKSPPVGDKSNTSSDISPVSVATFDTYQERSKTTSLTSPIATSTQLSDDRVFSKPIKTYSMKSRTPQKKVKLICPIQNDENLKKGGSGHGNDDIEPDGVQEGETSGQVDRRSVGVQQRVGDCATADVESPGDKTETAKKRGRRQSTETESSSGEKPKKRGRPSKGIVSTPHMDRQNDGNKSHVRRRLSGLPQTTDDTSSSSDLDRCNKLMGNGSKSAAKPCSGIVDDPTQRPTSPNGSVHPVATTTLTDADYIHPTPPSGMLSSPPGSSAEDEAGKGRPFLGPGVSVFARWQDSFYYPGIVLSEEKNDKFKVKFEDGDQRSVAEKDLIMKGWLEKYSSVMAASTDEDFYEPGVVVGYYKNYDTEEEGYVIEKDEGDAKRYSRKNVILTSDQAALHINPQKLKTPSHGISLDNLITGKRSRNSSAKKASTTPSRRAKGSEQDVCEGDQNVQKQESIKRKLAGRESDNVHESPRKKGKVANTRNLTVDVEGTPKVNVLPSTPPPFDETDGVSAMATAESSSRQLRRSPRKLSSVTPTQGPYTSPVRIGPIPAERDPMPTDRTLLKNYGFLLTCGEKKKPPIVPTSQGDWSDESLPEEDVPEVPFDKDLITKLIRAGGGKVLKSFDDAIKFPKRVYLLANTYCRTKKYFQCLAAGISCVSHVWLRDCCQVNQLLEITAYLLPAGENIEENRIMEVQPTNTVLRGLRVLVISRNTTDPDFEDFWTSVLLAAKCAKVSKLPVDFSVSKQPRKSFNYEVIVTDASCPEDLIDKASQLDIPVVGCEWVIQCLINGRRMAYGGHPRYRYQYCP